MRQVSTYCAVLEQLNDGERQPLGFYSKKLSENESEWSTYERELYAIYMAIQIYEYLLEGRDLILVTDHKPLLHMFKQKMQRVSRFIEYISQFTNRIEHLPGISNVIADAFSRPSEIASITAPITVEAIAEAQRDDDEIKEIRSGGFGRQTFQETTSGEKSILCNVYKNASKPVIPKKLRFPLFQQVHQISHTETKATIRLMQARYWWKDLIRDVKNWCRACAACHKSKVIRHTVSPLQAFPQSDRFETIHVDIVGPLPNINGYRYLVTMIDRASRWMEVIPTRNMLATTVASVFYKHWVSRYGVPHKLVSDRGGQFRSELFNEMCKLLGANHIKITSYNPKANGAIERLHRRLKESIKALGKRWMDALSGILLGLRSAPRDETGVTYVRKGIAIAR